MGLTNTWWGDFAGETDDSLLLLDYLEQKGATAESIKLSEVFADLHMTEDLKNRTIATSDLYWIDEDFEPHFNIGIDVVIDLSVIVLEALEQGEISLSDFDKDYGSSFQIKSTSVELNYLAEALNDFVQDPLSHDVGELLSEEDLASLCKQCVEIVQKIKQYAA